ncbi:MAG TPA: glycosyltransferase family 2 protein [Candidatus Bathyarchaeia archaeon]|nr:MAG: hypothetical protein A3K70_01140 [Candidatus Bathyarchaeota archaeon RBG_16_48_13]HJX23703.1 glycosyltransferase family 2 protein [Candidatus Bathyarchaeia archaeon]
MQLTEILVISGLIETLILFSYAVRYYLFSLTVLFFRNSGKEEPTISGHAVGQFVSIMLPVYNEPNVVDRLLKSCTSFDYPNYEVLALDDSTDETTAKLEKWKAHPRVKVIHRNSRKGWKGGALNEGLEHLDTRSTHVLILDADFVPPKDLLQRFLAKYCDGGTVAVQGYQNHDLNAEENWLTKGVRVLYSIDNMVELNAKNKLKLFNYLTGSVFMIKTEILKRFKFEDDLTEDWNLALRLYEAGYKIIYDPTLKASGECPQTLFRLFKQNLRWAEGHTRNVRRHLFNILFSKLITRREKLEFLLLGSIYFNAIFVVGLTLLGIFLIPYFSLVLANPFAVLTWLLALIGIPSTAIAALVALSLEGAKKDFGKIPNALFLGYISTPIMAYGALKGIFTDNGHFQRTYKTGRIARPNRPNG